MIKDIKKWFETAIPEPTIEQACIQIGVDAEECAELFQAFGDYDISERIDEIANKYKSCTPAYCGWVATLNEYQKTQVLDALCDKIVTAIGVAHMLGMDIESALSEVNDSNYSKFEDNKPVFKCGKISKGKYYKPPQLDKFI